MIKPIPTVEMLVAIFKEKGWTPTPWEGCIPENVQAGRCCAAPALATWLNPDMDMHSVRRVSEIYSPIYDQYGDAVYNLMLGFDTAPDYTSRPLTAIEKVWYDLGFELHMALKQQEEQHVPQ